MRKSLAAAFCLYILFLVFTTNFLSCSSERKIKYFQDIPDSGQAKQIREAEFTPLVIRNGDLLNVVIELIDPGAANMITAGNQIPAPANSFPSNGGTASLLATLSGGGQQSQIQPVNGYLVDNNGLIEIPIIGKIKATGLTIYSLKDTIVKVASKYYKNPVVVVRFANFKVDIAGEVLKPGQYVMPEEKETILDAISMAGDLTIFGKRENVLLLRENTDGSKTAYRINLKKSNVMSSPAYYLQQNDVIYVEPRKAKSDATDAAQTRYITIASAVLSILVIIATRTK